MHCFALLSVESLFAWQHPFTAPGCFCLAYHAFLKNNKNLSEKGYYMYSSQLDTVYNKHTP